MIINPSWSFKDIFCNLRTLTLQYEECLASFVILRERNDFIRRTRNSLYALKFDNFKKDKIWEFMNGYLSSWEVISIFSKMKGD